MFEFDLLTFFDEITNTVLMPVCALAVCVAAGYGIKKSEMAENLFPKKPLVGTVVSYMARFVTPILILVVAVFGVVSNVSENTNYYFVIAGAVLLSLAAASVYFFARLDRKNTGCNADELASIADED